MSHNLCHITYVVGRIKSNTINNQLHTDFDQFLEASPAKKQKPAKTARMKTIAVLTILQFVSGDLIGWNRSRNTVYKSRMNGQKNRRSNLTPLMNQYNAFRLVKNGVSDLQELVMKYTKKNKQKPTRQNRRNLRFRQFHQKL